MTPRHWIICYRRFETLSGLVSSRNVQAAKVKKDSHIGFFCVQFQLQFSVFFKFYSDFMLRSMSVSPHFSFPIVISLCFSFQFKQQAK